MDAQNTYEKAETVSIDTLSLEEWVKEDRLKEISQLHSLSKKVCYLHTDLLYYRNAKSKIGATCYEAWKVLVKKVGGTPNGWRDLGYALGIGQEDLDYIMASVIEDPVDMVLKVFRQNEKATIDKIVDAFIKMKRYDIVKALEEPLCKLYQYFNKNDSGYQSNDESTGHREIVSLRNLSNDLPLALNKNMVTRQKDPNKPNQTLQPATNKQKTVSKDEHILFLTFAQDGLPTAINIQDYVNNWTNFRKVKVITLNSRREEIYQNPEKFIREYFEKADFIVPILTPGYFEEIESHNMNSLNTSDNLDYKYANFIYNLLINHYIHVTGCHNKKVRSVIPQNAHADIIQKISVYIALLPWTYETNFDEQFQAFLNIECS